MGILIFKGLTARRLYKSFGVKGLIVHNLWLAYMSAMSEQLSSVEFVDVSVEDGG
jgi:hypothetical protein